MHIILQRNLLRILILIKFIYYIKYNEVFTFFLNKILFEKAKIRNFPFFKYNLIIGRDKIKSSRVFYKIVFKYIFYLHKSFLFQIFDLRISL